MSDLIYYCTNENNTCPKKDSCKRYLEMASHPDTNTTLFKIACTKDNEYVLYIEKEEQGETINE